MVRRNVQDPSTCAEGAEASAKTLQKRFSCKSESVLGRLGEFEAQFNDIEESIKRIAEGFHSGELTPPGARDHLAQVEALLDKLQFNGVDSIETFELESGKDKARSLRKELVRRAEELHGRMEEIFKEIKVASALPTSGIAPAVPVAPV